MVDPHSPAPSTPRVLDATTELELATPVDEPGAHEASRPHGEATLRVAALVMPGPVFSEPQRPTEATATRVEDVDGHSWAPILLWLDPSKVDPVPRFDLRALTITIRRRTALEPLAALSFLPLEPGSWSAELTGPGVAVPLTVQWTKDDRDRHSLVLTRTFTGTNERENIRSAILSGGIHIRVQWTHRARVQQRTRRRMALDGRVGARLVDLRRPELDPPIVRPPPRRPPLGIPPHRLPPIHHIPPQPPPPQPPPPQPPPPQPPPPQPPPATPPTPLPLRVVDYTFTQSIGLDVVRSSPSDPMWLDRPSDWKRIDDLPRRMVYRYTGTPGRYEYLPTEFRLGFDTARAIPAITAHVYDPEGEGEADARRGARVRLSLVAVPRTDRADREALRERIQHDEDVELAILVPPVATGRFEVEVGPVRTELASPTDKTIPLDGKFTLHFDVPVSAWDLVLAQLDDPGGGVVGKVFLVPDQAGRREDLYVPVTLTLQELHVNAVKVLASPSSSAAEQRIVLRNDVDERIMIASPSIHLYRRDDAESFPRHARRGRLKGFVGVMGPREQREYEIEPEGDRSPWNRILIDLDAASLREPPEGWAQRVSLRASESEAVHRVTVDAKNLGPSWPAPPAHYHSTAVCIRSAMSHDILADGVLTASQATWSTELRYSLADLWARRRDPARAKPYVVELQSHYRDGTQGVLQRLRVEQQHHVLVTVLTDERPDSRYRLLDDQQRVQATDLDRDAVLGRIGALQAAGESWLLSVIAPPDPAAPPRPDEVPPVAPPPQPEPPVETIPAGPPFHVEPAGMDFERFPEVFVTLEVVHRGQRLTSSMKLDAATARTRSWSPPREPDTPVAYTMLFMRREGGPPVRVDGRETSDLLMVLAPDG